MIDKIILSAAFGLTGWTNLYPDAPAPLTLQQKAKQASVSTMCNKKPKSKTAKELCKRWEKHNA